MSLFRCLLLSLLFLSSIVLISAKQYIVQNDYAPRIQWDANQGYCGELSLLTFGLSNGQYLSQYDARVAVCGKGSQSTCQMLVGENDVRGANNMHYVNEEWNSDSGGPQEFLMWTKKHIAAGHLVIGGVYDNYCTAADDNADDGICGSDKGSAEYDHIVNFIGFTSRRPITDSNYYSDDELIIDDHYESILRIPFNELINSRVDANRLKSPPYSLPDQICYGIAIISLKAEGIYPINLVTNGNFEKPVMQNGEKRPPPMPMTLKVTISGLTAGISYSLLTYNDLKKVPERDFLSSENVKNIHSRVDFIAASDVVVIDKVPIRSDQVVIYRCVRT